MNISKLVAVSAWLFTFFFFMSFTGNTAQSEFFFCVIAASVVSGIAYANTPSGGDNNELTSQEV